MMHELPGLYAELMQIDEEPPAPPAPVDPAPPPPPPPLATASPDGVMAELENDDQLEGMDGAGSVMYIYLSAVLQQLKQECSTGKAKAGKVDWLLPLLKENDYWLRAHKAKHVCSKLGITFTCEAYYTDVRVWVPQREFGVEGTPMCVSCNCACRFPSECMQKCPMAHMIATRQVRQRDS